MRDSLLRVIDDLETEQKKAMELSRKLDRNYWYGFHDSLAYSIQELRKVLDDHPKV